MYITCKQKAGQAKGSTQEELVRTLLDVLATCLTHISSKMPKWHKETIHEWRAQSKQVGHYWRKLWIQDSSPDTPGLPQQDGGFDECAEYNGVFISVQYSMLQLWTLDRNDTWHVKGSVVSEQSVVCQGHIRRNGLVGFCNTSSGQK